MDIRVIKVTEFNSEVKFNFWGHYHCCSRVPRAIALSLECTWRLGLSRGRLVRGYPSKNGGAGIPGLVPGPVPGPAKFASKGRRGEDAR